MREVFEMHPVYENTSGYYGKAKIVADGIMRYLYSYADLAASYNMDTKEFKILFSRGEIPPTTIRHLREFANQYGYLLDGNLQLTKKDF